MDYHSDDPRKPVEVRIDPDGRVGRSKVFDTWSVMVERPLGHCVDLAPESLQRFRTTCDQASCRHGYENSVSRKFYKSGPLRSQQEIRKDILALTKQTDGLVIEIVWGGTMIFQGLPTAYTPCARLFKAAYHMDCLLSLVMGWRTHGTESRPCDRQSDIAGGGPR